MISCNTLGVEGLELSMLYAAELAPGFYNSETRNACQIAKDRDGFRN